MSAFPSQFLDEAQAVLTPASADLATLMADPLDHPCARRLSERLEALRALAAQARAFEVARLADEALAPLSVAVAARRAVDRPSMQTVGWAMQALNGALTTPPSRSSPLSAAA